MPTPTPHARTPVRGPIGMLSTYPPRLCGLATFAAALETALVEGGEQVTMVAVREPGERRAGPGGPRHELRPGDPGSIREAARVLSSGSVAIVQHEYGIYGGDDGDEVLDVLRQLHVPAVVVLHTVPSAPTDHQRSVLEAVCDAAALVVVMTSAARDRLLAGYAVDGTKVDTIPHGASASGPILRVLTNGRAARLRLLTWGLLGPGKGIEHVIGALSLLQDLRPRIGYTVAGATHPHVLARDGERYRESLVDLAHDLGVADLVTFDDTYRDLRSLSRLVASSSLVVLPYDSRDQVTSGVLVDAVAAGRPVIATAFPHAVELLSDGAGSVVPHGDPVALAGAIRAAFDDPALLTSMTVRAGELAPALSWTSVAERYREACAVLAPVAARAAG